MLVRLFDDGSLRLEEEAIFSSLKVVTSSVPKTINAKDSSILDLQGDYAWISCGWLKQQGRPAEDAWSAGFAAMLRYAQTKGWYDEARDRVRAHIQVE